MLINISHVDVSFSLAKGTLFESMNSRFVDEEIERVLKFEKMKSEELSALVREQLKSVDESMKRLDEDEWIIDGSRE